MNGELRRQLNGPKITEVYETNFGLPVSYSVGRDLDPKQDIIQFESQAGFLIRKSKDKWTAQIFADEEPFRRFKDIEQIYPTRKLY